MKTGLDNMRMKANLSEYIPRKIMQDTIFNPRYKSIDKIGSGSFGEIHKVYDMVDKKLRAVKIEKKDKRGAQGMLLKEAYIMKQMKDCHHFPRLIEEMQNDQMSFIIMSFLGQNLESLKKKYNKLSHYTTLLIGTQMVEALELMHVKGFLHRDIKPENFVIGTEGNHHNIYIIDFGLSKKYIDLNNKHIPEDNNKGLVGTARYTSINSHRGIEQSRRDDLEALGYVLIYLAKGELPWQNLTLEKREEKFEQIKHLKIDTKLDDLCKGLPNSFKTYMEHVKGLSFEQEPKYKFLQQSFLKDAKQIQEEKNIPIESQHCLDWCENNCSIKKQYSDQIQRQLQLKMKQQNGNSILSTPQVVNTEDNSDVKRRETQFTETAQFYEDTVERPQDSTFEVPLFRTEQSLTLSRHSFGNIPHFTSNPQIEDIKHLSSSKSGQNLINGRSSTDMNLPYQINISQNGGEDEHSQNSSQYNNVSSEYTPMQDEKVKVQKVVASSPIRFCMTDNQLMLKSAIINVQSANNNINKSQSMQNIQEVQE
ncbi:hypothetical protein ABPG72_014372 [Tetrahymena utriculariae]